MNGAASKTGETTTFEGVGVVIGGTGNYANATGSTSWTGSRTGAVGSPVEFNWTLALAQ
ncbi:MAG: hypothetical protein F2842_09200 [Actinobacteria bacterium]|nr:hypothetical protein [Actinomycetota bacterium]